MRNKTVVYSFYLIQMTQNWDSKRDLSISYEPKKTGTSKSRFRLI